MIWLIYYPATYSLNCNLQIKLILYQIPSQNLNNQSEDSIFLLLLPFLLIPCLYISFEDYRKSKPADWPLIIVNLVFLLALAWLFTHIPVIGKLSLLDRVPLNRLIIGLGILNIN